MREARMQRSGWIMAALSMLMMALLGLGVVAMVVEMVLSLFDGRPLGAVTLPVTGLGIAIAMLLGGLAALLLLGRRLAREIAAEIGRLRRVVKR